MRERLQSKVSEYLYFGFQVVSLEGNTLVTGECQGSSALDGRAWEVDDAGVACKPSDCSLSITHDGA